MLPLHFNKQVFIDALKANDSTVYAITTIALLATVLFQGTINGNLKPEYFVYGLIVSIAFCMWGLIDRKFRQLKQQQNLIEKVDE